VRRMPPDAGSQFGVPGEDRLAGRAGSKMLLERHAARQIELLVEIGVQPVTALGAVHVMTPAGCVAGAAAAACELAQAATSRCRAECRRSPRSPCTTDLRALSAR